MSSLTTTSAAFGLVPTTYVLSGTRYALNSVASLERTSPSNGLARSNQTLERWASEGSRDREVDFWTSLAAFLFDRAADGARFPAPEEAVAPFRVRCGGILTE